MVIINNRYDLMDFAESKGLFSIYDLFDKLQPMHSGIAGTDGKTIYVNPEEFNKLEMKDQFFILAHEMLHIVYKHTEMSKTEFPDHQLLNICQDVTINELLYKRLRFRPNDGVFLDSIEEILHLTGHLPSDRKLDYTGLLTTRSLYKYIDSMIPKDCRAMELLYSLSDGLMTPNGDSDSMDEEMIDEVIETFRISKVHLAAEQMPAEQFDDFKKTVGKGKRNKQVFAFGAPVPDEILSTKEIIDFVNNFVGNYAVTKGMTQTYTRPNRRVQSKQYVLKGRKRVKNINEISIYLDTSGSMSQDFVSGMYKTLKTLYQTTKFKLYAFNTSVLEIDFSKDDTPWTSGGTCIQRVLSHIKKNNNAVSIMITDCEDSFSLKDVNSDVLIFTNDLNFKSDNPKVRVANFHN